MMYAIPLTLLIVSLLTGRDAWPFQLTNAPHGTTPDTDTEARWCAPGGGDGSPGTQCDPLAANKTVNVKYRWNPTGFVGTGWDTQIQAAAATWNAEPPDFTLTYAGTTTIPANPNDNINVIIGADLGPPIGLFKLTEWWIQVVFQPITTSSEPDTLVDNASTMARILDVDVKININPQVPWWRAAACPPGNYFDLQSVMTTTFGGFLSLGVLTQPEVGALSPHPMMYYLYQMGECRRILHPDDQAGIWYLYQLDLR